MAEQGPITVYKILSRDGTSTNVYWKWPIVPSDVYDSSAYPTDWIEIGKGEKPVICKVGFHGWLTEEIALGHKAPLQLLFEMELEGDIVDDGQKATGRRARLTQLLFDHEGMVVRLSDYIWQ